MFSKRKTLAIVSIILVVIVVVPVGMYLSFPDLFQNSGGNGSEPTSTPVPSPTPTLSPSPSPTSSPTPTPTPMSTPTPSPTLTPTGSYNKSIIRNTDTAEEENALSVAENTNYTTIFEVERLYSVGGSGYYNYTWANFIDEEVLNYFDERFERLIGQPRNMTFSYEANVYSWNHIEVVYASSTYPIQVVSSNGTILFRNADYTGVNFGMRFFYRNDSGYQEIQTSQINFSFTTSYVVEMKLNYLEIYGPLAGYLSDVYQIIIVDEYFEPLFLCFTANNGIF